MSEESLIKTPTVFGENGNFLLERELGMGGMGGVYLGRDKMLDRPVAVKVMLKEYGSDAEFVEKFKREAQAAARLIHPNIAQIYSYGISDGMPYIAMELVAGGSLSTIMENTGANSDVARVMKLCEQVAQALRCASDQGLVHGDVKPENILLDSNGNAKLVDFGLAAMQKNTDEIWGTPYYIAPEKVLKERADYRADMYSLGATMYHALCGTAPFEGEDAAAVVRKRLDTMPRKPSEVRPGLSPQIDAFVMRMLARNPQDRFPTFEALLAEFKKVLTTGLDPVPQRAEAKPFAPSSVSTGAKLSIKRHGKKGLSLKKQSPVGAGAAAPQETAGEEAPASKPSKLSLRRAKKFKAIKTDLAAAASAAEGGAGGESGEAKKDSVGFKVFGFAGAMVLVICLVVGALLWYQASVEAKEKREHSAQVAKSWTQGRNNINNNVKLLNEFTAEFETFAKETVKDCEKFTGELRKALAAKYSKNVLAMLVPPATEELKKAVAMTNECPALASTIAAIGADKLVGSAPAGTAADGAKKNVRKHSGFRKPVGDETDPNSEEGIKYLEEKKKWEEARAAGKAAGGKDASGTEAPKEIAVTGTSEEIPSAVTDMRGMWERAYGCQAAAIRIKKSSIALLADADRALAIPNNDTEANAKEVVDISNALTSSLEVLRSSDDVKNSQKSKSFISNKGRKTVESTLRRLREEAAQAARAEKKRQEIAREKAEKEAKAKAHAAKVAEEEAAAKDKFRDIVEKGTVRQLDWAGGKRQLRQLKEMFETVEGENQIKRETEKIEMMEAMQKAMVDNMKGYVFTRGELAGFKVTAVDFSVITVKKGESKSKKIAWSEFLQSKVPNLQELVFKFVKNGRKDVPKKLDANTWQKAMLGSAMVVHFVCGAQKGADKYCESLVKTLVEAFPSFASRVKECLPSVKVAAPASDEIPDN